MKYLYFNRLTSALARVICPMRMPSGAISEKVKRNEGRTYRAVFRRV